MEKKNIVLLILIIAFGVIGILIFKNSTSGSQIYMKKEITALANELNEKCPMQVDNITTLKSVKIGDKTWRYNYSLNIDPDTIDLEDFKKQGYNRILNDLKRDPNSKKYFILDFTIFYDYYTPKGQLLFQFDYPPNSYGTR